MEEEVTDYNPGDESYMAVRLLRDIVRRVALDSFECHLDPDDAAAAVLLALVDIVHEGALFSKAEAISMVRSALDFASSASIARDESSGLIPDENENGHDPVVVAVMRHCNFS
jgi:hypothetical protein